MIQGGRQMCWKVIGGRHHRPICWALKQPQTHPEPTIATAYSNPTVVQTRWFWDMDTVNQLQIVVVILTLHNQAKFYQIHANSLGKPTL